MAEFIRLTAGQQGAFDLLDDPPKSYTRQGPTGEFTTFNWKLADGNFLSTTQFLHDKINEELQRHGNPTRAQLHIHHDKNGAKTNWVIEYMGQWGDESDSTASEAAPQSTGAPPPQRAAQPAAQPAQVGDPTQTVEAVARLYEQCLLEAAGICHVYGQEGAVFSPDGEEINLDFGPEDVRQIATAMFIESGRRGIRN